MARARNHTIGDAFLHINPATGEVLETLEPTSPPQIQNILAGAHAAFLEWRTQPFARRATLMRAAARELRARKDEYALTMTREMGKPIVQAEAEVEKCAGTCDYYAEHAEAFLAEQPRACPRPHSPLEFSTGIPAPSIPLRIAWIIGSSLVV